MTLKPGSIVIDWSFAELQAQAVAAAGADGVIRYSAGAASDPDHKSHAAVAGKLISPPEHKALRTAGLDIIANDEWYETRVTEGAAAGREDGHAAATLWKSCGHARGAAIYPSWDADPDRAHWDSAVAYLRAFGDEIDKIGGYVVGVYAGTPFLKYAKRHGVKFCWRPNAGSWSNDGLPYQPDTSPAKRAALVRLARKASPAHIWQTGNYWFDKNADENLIVRVPVGSHLEAQAASKPEKPHRNPAPKPKRPKRPTKRHHMSWAWWRHRAWHFRDMFRHLKGNRK